MPDAPAPAKPKDPELEKLELEFEKAKKQAELLAELEKAAKTQLSLKSIGQETQTERVAREKAVTDQRKAEADADKAKADADKAKVDVSKAKSDADKAETDALKAKFRTDATVTPPAGDFTSTGEFIETQILVRNSLRRQSELIISNLKTQLTAASTSPAQFIIYDPATIAGLTAYVSFVQQVSSLKNAFSNALASAESAISISVSTNEFAASALPLSSIPTIAVGVVKTLAEVAQFFRVDTKIDNADVVIPTTDLIALLHHQISALQLPWSIYYPELFPVNLLRNSVSRLTSDLDDVSRLALQARETSEKITKLIADNTSLSPGIAKTLKQSATNLDVLSQTQQTVQTQLTSVDTSDKSPLLSSLIQAEGLHKLMNDPSKTVYILKADVKARGSNRVIKSAFLPTKIRHSAGLMIVCLVFDVDGQIVATSTTEEYTPYQRPKKIRTQGQV